MKMYYDEEIVSKSKLSEKQRKRENSLNAKNYISTTIMNLRIKNLYQIIILIFIYFMFLIF